jgi:hypothetical protein
VYKHSKFEDIQEMVFNTRAKIFLVEKGAK